MAEANKIRIDKWLWAVRVFKTRTLATEACDAGKIKINGNSVKPSYQLKIGETVHIRRSPQMMLIYKVVGLIEKRVSAELAAPHYEDISPPPPPVLDSAFVALPNAYRKRGEGRPTKRDRRQIDRLNDDLSE
ncbi:MAG: RNA-binding S4 domain-containing protein [Sphingobacteriales bacterium]|nr:RNA-binding S4 domain-containing protein [Sphingobacteriales bacterium]